MRLLQICAVAIMSISGAAYGTCIAHELPQLSFGVGAFNIFRADLEAQFQIEYQSGIRLELETFPLSFFPLAGVMATSRGSTYLYAGFGADYRFMNHLAIIPSLAVGYYARGGGKRLHYPVEFRSALEVAYVFDNDSRIGLQISHISNAGIGHRNPGVESLVALYTIPLYNLRGY